MLESLSEQIKELIRLPFWRKVPNGSKHYAGKYLDGKAHYYYNENADGRVYEGSFYYLGKYFYTLTAKPPTMSAAPTCTTASTDAGSSITSAADPTSCSMSTTSRDAITASTATSRQATATETLPTTRLSLR